MRHWLIERLAGRTTVVLNAHFGVRRIDNGLLPTLENADVGSTLVWNVTGLGIPGYGRLEEV